ncbi:MAG: EAL domain-containing protein [Rhodobacteraceae bacterium]|nr:EAL domain-containing protein [Paracoccaceae bacterium]
MKSLHKLLDWITLHNVKDDLVIAQFRELTRQIPVMYFLLIANSWAVTYSHLDVAPHAENLYIAIGLTVVSLARVFYWRLNRNLECTPAMAASKLRQVLIIALALGLFHVTWALNLDQYGNDLQRSQVAIFIAITVIGCTFCLAHLPQAGVIVTAVVMVPYLIHYLYQDEMVFTAMAFNIAAVCLAMQRVFLNMFSEFKKLLESREVLAEKQAETELLSLENRKLAHTCPLTGIPNRRFFFQQVAQSLGKNRSFAIGLLDLDNFKPVNDTYGHKVGDQLLIEIGRRLAELESENFTAARLGGDEFGFIYTGYVTDREAIRSLGQSLCDKLSKSCQLGETKVSIGCSCGIVISDPKEDQRHALYDRADLALYESKSQRRGMVTIYSEDLGQKKRHEEEIEAALHSANLDEELEVSYQPIVNLQNDSIVGYEALARWTNPTLGSISPDIFISLAERAGLIRHMTITLFRKALKGHSVLGADLCMSFNLSAHDVTSKETILELIAICHANHVRPEFITFELTETAVIDSLENAEENLRMLRACGFKIALDDFGTGYSSLAYLHRLPIDKVKVDRSFISNLHNRDTRDIVKSIIALCYSMSLDCIIEGVENRDQIYMLAGMGGQNFQGYAIAKPMFVEEAVNWAETASWKDLIPGTAEPAMLQA